MFFQFSPVRPEAKPKVPVKRDEIEEPTILSLAPFSANPKVFFEDITVGQTAKRQIIIKNPTNNDIILHLKDDIPEELNVGLSWTSQKISRNDEVILEVTWNPISVGGFRFTITLEDGVKIRRSIPIVLKSVSPKLWYGAVRNSFGRDFGSDIFQVIFRKKVDLRQNIMILQAIFFCVVCGARSVIS